MLLVICVVLFAMTQSLKQGGLAQPGLMGVGTLLRSGGATGALIGIGTLAASMMCLIAWGWAETVMADELLHTRHSTLYLRVHRGSFVGASMAAFWRDVSNRIGLVGMATVCLLGVWLESLTGVGMAFLTVSGAGVMLISAAGLYAYGEFLVLCWRVVTRPPALCWKVLARQRVGSERWQWTLGGCGARRQSRAECRHRDHLGVLGVVPR